MNPETLVIIWGIINTFWITAIFIMFLGVIIGGFLVTSDNFKYFSVIKLHLEFSIILIALYLWRESIFAI